MEDHLRLHGMQIITATRLAVDFTSSVLRPQVMSDASGRQVPTMIVRPTAQRFLLVIKRPAHYADYEHRRAEIEANGYTIVTQQ